MMNEYDQVRFMRLWTAAQPAVSSYVHALVWDAAAAEDVVQEVSIALFRRFGEYDETRPFIAWALGVAKFQVLGLIRDNARNRVIFDDELLGRFTDVWAERAPRLTDRGAALQECLEVLPARARNLVRLRYFEELTSEQIAGRLGGTGAAIRVALQRIRRQLRECVERRLRVAGDSP
ncbi:MAG: sigma-70 family RNA polymerase sigma factor [Planctomycetota bacterium]